MQQTPKMTYIVPILGEPFIKRAMSCENLFLNYFITGQFVADIAVLKECVRDTETNLTQANLLSRIILR